MGRSHRSKGEVQPASWTCSNGAQIEFTKSSLDVVGAVWAKGKTWLVASDCFPYISKGRAGDTHWGAWGTFKTHPLQCRCGRHLFLVSLYPDRKLEKLLTNCGSRGSGEEYKISRKHSHVGFLQEHLVLKTWIKTWKLLV